MSLASKLSDGQPLPPNPYEQGSDNYEAYERCLQLERRPAWNAVLDDLPHSHPYEDILRDMTSIVTARVLGHGLCFAPNDSGRNALVCDILACSQLELALLAYLYVFGLIRVCTSAYVFRLLQ